MTALTTAELVFRTLTVLAAIGIFAVVSIGGTWLYAKTRKASVKQPKSRSRSSAPRHA